MASSWARRAERSSLFGVHAGHAGRPVDAEAESPLLGKGVKPSADAREAFGPGGEQGEPGRGGDRHRGAPQVSSWWHSSRKCCLSVRTWGLAAGELGLAPVALSADASVERSGRGVRSAALLRRGVLPSFTLWSSSSTAPAGMGSA